FHHDVDSVCFAGFHLHVVESQYIPKTCQCPQVKQSILNVPTELGLHVLLFSVFFIRVTQQKNNSPVCLSPDGPQGKRLLQCWQRTPNGKDRKKCIHRQKQKPRQRNRKQVKSRKVKS
uniref:Uncharacterized protein n=1 Tax=Cyprinus carpio TaxID=7962 RepID=A0A8C1S309_CYPCA